MKFVWVFFFCLSLLSLSLLSPKACLGLHLIPLLSVCTHCSPVEALKAPCDRYFCQTGPIDLEPGGDQTLTNCIENIV